MKIVNFGSLNNDIVYKVDHFVRPGETLSADLVEASVGGKGLNQSIAASRAGTRVMHVGKVGSDGSELLNALKQAGVDITLVEQSAHRSGHAVIQVDKTGQNSIILHGGANLDVDRYLIDRAFASIEKEDILLTQNEISNIAYLMEKAHENGIRLALNPSPMTAQLLKCPLDYVEWFFLNETEGMALTEAEDCAGITRRLMKRFPRSKVVLTLGENGVLYRDSEQLLSYGAYEVEPVDTTGAGDTFTGYFLSGIAKGLSIAENLRLASIASALAVSRKGASLSIPLLEDVTSSNLSLKHPR